METTNVFELKEKEGREKFEQICEKIYSAYTINFLDLKSRADIEITGTPMNKTSKIYTCELKLRKQSYKDSNYDSVLFEKSKYDALKQMQNEKPNRKYYYINIWQKDNEVHFFDVDIVDKLQLEVKTIKCRRNNQTYEYIEKEVYFLPLNKAYKLKLENL